ncbi:acyl-CoA dehydrogenase family protein [Lentzea albidocapillata]|uniref:Acyl-CoA dehydrogenase n=1 Tax=Lentzea albidocapillata TaxID=40571 RepID=A0A1W2DH80_9PSEU|nr:acyl-CoA dehydrogenase family protein [Lentzea albidocapillata]SMC96268.1 acyl-CoA dehydrogenase [Lentzea albidocapillata]
MDFRLSEDQTTVVALARGAFERRSDPLRTAGIEATADRFDRQLWQELADSGVLGLAVPEDQGGIGLGMAEFAPALLEQGRTLGMVPLWETVVLGVLPIARYGDEKQRDTWLRRVAEGTAVLTAALEQPGQVPLHATDSGDGPRLTGVSPGVPGGHLADAVVVPARTTGGTVELFLVPTDLPGVTRHRVERTDRGIATDLELVDVPAERLGAGPEEDRLEWLLRRAWVGLAAIQLGVSQASVRQAADYVAQRHQFGVPLATFQAVAHQAANCHIDTEAMEVTFWNALWRLETGRDATAAVHVAKWWAADAGDRVARTVQHLHGGLGADITYPIHRYMLWTTQLANTLGSAAWHLHRIGGHVAGGAA